MRFCKSFVVASMLAASGILAGCVPPDKKPPVAETSKNIYGDLPNIMFIPEEGEWFSGLKLSGNSVIIFFAPDCDHCQRQAADMQQHMAAFKKYKLYFVSMADFAEMHRFAVEYKLDKEPNVGFYRAEGNSVTEALGNVSTPTICIYDADKKLKKRFDGETPMEGILPVL